MPNFQYISMQWLHFVNELDCYKGKENKKQLLNIMQVLCSDNIVTLKYLRYSIKKLLSLFWLRCLLGSQSKTNHTCLKTTYKTRNLHECLRFFYLDLHIKLLKGKCLGSSIPPTHPQSKQRINRLFVLSFKSSNNKPNRSWFFKYFMVLVAIKDARASIDKKSTF